jgi:hypothetical protein
MTELQQYAVRSRAAYRQAKTEVAISHASCLPLLDAPVWGLDLSEVHLTRLDGRTGRREAGVRQHCGVLLDGDTIIDHGTRLSSPIRATLEVTTLGSTESALIVANHFLHRGDYTQEQLRHRYERSIRLWPESLRADAVIRLADSRIESVGETRTFHFLWKWHFPRPEPQWEVYDNGQLIALLDFALPEQKIWIEFDGRVKYQALLKEGEDVTTVVLREKRREERVAEITGWRCLRITWADLENPGRLATRIRRLIEMAA